MFAIKLLRQSSKIDLRYFSRRVKPNVKLQNLLGSDMELEDGDFADFESDFMTVDLSHKEYVKEQKMLNEKTKHLIVRQKYFKEKSPNFLTWTEKEQIRYLHHSDPEEWTFEKLSEGFPALPEVISKIVKSTWTKPNARKIQNHDMAVKRNWESFKKGELGNLPEKVTKHLLKFQDRDLDLKQKVPLSEETKQPPRRQGEFSEIIRSYEKLKQQNADVKLIEENDLLVDKKLKKETYLLTPREKFKNKQHVQLKFTENQPKTVPAAETSESQEITAAETENNAVIFKDKPKDYSFLKYPEKIKIPFDKRKPECVYKLNDCYYDADGEFLYRVPGMY